jgi:hypothetical protein
LATAWSRCALGSGLRAAKTFFQPMFVFRRNLEESPPFSFKPLAGGGISMDGIIYLVGLIVIVMFILSAFGLR